MRFYVDVLKSEEFEFLSNAYKNLKGADGDG